MKQLIAKFIADEQGQDIIEYALIGSFVSLGSYLGASALGTHVGNRRANGGTTRTSTGQIP